MALIVAEAGTNHHSRIPKERIERAKLCIDTAAECKADIVKFQLFVMGEKLFCPMEGDEKRWLRWKGTFLNLHIWHDLRDYAEEAGIELMLSAFQQTGVEWVNTLGLRHKVASRAAVAYPYDSAVGDLIVSTGSEQARALKRYGRVAWPYHCKTLQCVMEYPCPLSKSRWDGNDYDLESAPDTAGLSDHSGTPWPAIDAMARGAEIIEVHFRPPGIEEGPDAVVELTPEQLRMICDARDGFGEMNDG